MLSVRGSSELRAVVRAVKDARRDVRNTLNRATREQLNPVWRERVAAHARTPQDSKVIARGARILAGNPPVMVAATSKRPLSGGLVPVESWQGVEFGAAQGKVTTYRTTSRRGTSYEVRRHTNRALPARTRNGRVAFRAVQDIGPRAASLWVSIVVKVFADAFEAGS